jgi:ferredoxin
MKVRILADRCRGHTMCVLACPSVFDIDEDTGLASVADEVVPPSHREDVRQAQRSCPEDAIEIEE